MNCAADARNAKAVSLTALKVLHLTCGSSHYCLIKIRPVLHIVRGQVHVN